jgi:RNA polymerase sigma factor (sigma-70 family)
VATQTSARLPDRELVQRFAAQGDALAFEALLQRHGPMVWGVCRRVLHRDQDAEDAFQSTFLVLTRKAAALRSKESVGAWLYGVAHRLALNARAAALRRGVRESRVGQRPAPDALAEITGREMQAVLDEELARLPEKWRAPLLLCCLEGAARDEAARRLGLPLGTLKSRLERGRERLRARLERRGLTLSLPLLTTLLTDGAGRAVVPAGLLGATAQAVRLSRLGNPVKGGLTGMLAGKGKTILAVLAAVSVVVAGVAFAAQGSGGTKPSEPDPRARGPVEQKPDGKERVRTDRQGEPIPPAALRRLGSLRWRHGHDLITAVYSPDGKTLATAGEGGKIRLWDTATGRTRRTLRQGKTCILSLAISPDGQTLAAGGVDHDRRSHTLHPTRLVLWDLVSGKARRTFVDSNGFQRLAFSRNGRWLAAGTNNEKIRLWEAATGKELPALKVPLQSIMALAFSPDSRTLAGGCSDLTVRLWDMASGRERLRLTGHQKMIRALAFSPNGKLLAAGYDDRTVGLWDPATGKELRTLTGHGEQITTVAFSPDGRTLASAERGRGPVRLWDPATGKERHRLHGPRTSGWVECVTFSPDGKTLATADRYGTVLLWDVASGRRVQRDEGHEFSVMSVAVSPDGQTLASASWDGTVRLWDLAGGGLLRTLHHDASVDAVVFSPDGKLLASSGYDQTVRLWDLATGKELQRIRAGGWAGSPVVFTPDGRRLVVGSPAMTISIREVATGKEVRQWQGRGSPRLRALAISPDGKTLASADHPEWDIGGPREGDVVCLWDLASGTARRRLPGKLLMGLAFAADGRALLTGEEGSVRFRDVLTGQVLRRIDHAEIRYFCLSPDGKTLATASYDHAAIRLWEVATGRERLRLAGHADGAQCLAFTPDGRRLVSGGIDTTVMVWDLNPAATGGRSGDGRPVPPTWEQLWSRLRGDDAEEAYRAVWTLAAGGKEVTAFLRSRLRPAKGEDDGLVRRLIADLGRDRFAEREKAFQELARLGIRAKPALLDALGRKPSLETARRIEALLKALAQRPAPLSPEELQQLRGVEVLERLGTPAARELLAALARGAPAARLTREARASLVRLARRQSARP